MTHVPTHRIVIYSTVEPTNTPETAKYVAGLFLGYDAHARWVVSGPSAATAREKMETFWATERKSYEPRPGPKKGKPSEGMDAAPEPVSVTDDDDEVL